MNPMYDPCGEPQLLTATFFCQSCLEGHEAAFAGDHRQDTTWKASPYYQWLLSDLTQYCHVSSLRIVFPETNGYYHYHVETSLDRMNWDLLLEKKDNVSEPKDGAVYPVERNCRYIRITVSYCSAATEVEIRDVSIYGQPCGDLPLPSRLTYGGPVISVLCADVIEGFEPFLAEEKEPGWSPKALKTNTPGVYVGFKKVDFGPADKTSPVQLRMTMGLPVRNRAYYLDIRFALDDPAGPTVGKIHICYQFRPWSPIAVDLCLPNGDVLSGEHDLYILLDAIDAPQELHLLSMELAAPPFLSDKVLDFREDLEETAANAEYQVFFGDMHSHTAFSDGAMTPEFAYGYARDVAKLDFLGITEHSNCLDTPFDSDKSRKFRDLKAKAEEMTEKDRFIALCGTETTWYNQFGHMNLYCADFFLNAYEFKYDDPETYYRKLAMFPHIISQWNHPWSCGDRHQDLFQPYVPELDPMACTIEMTDQEGVKEDSFRLYVTALDAGWHLAPVGNQDNHKINWGTQNDMRIAVIAKRLTAGHIFDAMKHRRVYFTGAPGLKVLYYLNGAVQGSRIPAQKDLSLSVKACASESHSFTRLEVYGEHGRLLHEASLNSPVLNYSAPLPPTERYYFIKLIQDDSRFAVTAPVWVE